MEIYPLSHFLLVVSTYKVAESNTAQANNHSPACPFYHLPMGLSPQALLKPVHSVGICSFQFPAMWAEKAPLLSADREMLPSPSGTLWMSSLCSATRKGWQNQLFVWRCMVCYDWDLIFFFLTPCLVLFLFLFTKTISFPHVLQAVCSFQLLFFLGFQIPFLHLHKPFDF